MDVTLWLFESWVCWGARLWWRLQTTNLEDLWGSRSIGCWENSTSHMQQIPQPIHPAISPACIRIPNLVPIRRAIRSSMKFRKWGLPPIHKGNGEHEARDLWRSTITTNYIVLEPPGCSTPETAAALGQVFLMKLIITKVPIMRPPR